MNKLKLFIRNIGIHFEYLPHRFKGEIKGIFVNMEHTKFKLPKSPKNLMLLSAGFCGAFTLAGRWIPAIVFFILFIVLWQYKIWISGEPMVWYKNKYGLNK